MTTIDTTQYPWRDVVHLDVQFPDGEFQGSGVMVGPDEVLTAAHMVWEQGVGAAENVEVEAGLNGNTAPFGAVSATNWHFLQIADANGQESPDQSQYDIALVHLSEPIGNQIGWMGIEPNFSGGAVNVTGYPVSLDGINFNGDVMVSKNLAATLDPQLTLLDFPPGTTNHGDSGGPVWLIGSDNTPHVVGVVSAGGSTGDIAPIITSSLFRDLQQWAAADHTVL